MRMVKTQIAILFALLLSVSANGVVAYSLEDEAGISAYVNLGQPISLSLAKNAFKSINHETETYIWGMLNIPAYREELRPWAYVSSDGWIFVYLPKEFGRAGIFYQGNNNLEAGIEKICQVLGFTESAFDTNIKPNIKYYDFEFPQASELYLFYERAYYSSNTLKIFIPNSTAWYRVEYGAWGGGGNSFNLDGNRILTNVGGYTYGYIPETQFAKGVWHTFLINGGEINLIVVVLT